MKIELLYFDGCPSWQAGFAHLTTALHDLKLAADIQLVLVRDDQDAERLRFLGSPSFRVNGEELWPEAREQFALGCRVYQTPQGLTGVPSVAMLRDRIAPFAAAEHRSGCRTIFPR